MLRTVRLKCTNGINTGENNKMISDLVDSTKKTSHTLSISEKNQEIEGCLIIII